MNGHRLKRLTMLAVPVLAALAVLVPSPAAAVSPSTPEALLHRLLTSPVPKSELPGGYGSPVVGRYRPTAKAKSHHAIGGVQIDLEGGTAAVLYIIFPNRADAEAHWQTATLKGLTTAAGPAYLPEPSLVVNTWASGKSDGKSMTVGVTNVAYRFENVIVEALTTSTTSTKHGDVHGAEMLARFALVHLVSVWDAA